MANTTTREAKVIIPTNKYQTPITDLLLEQYPAEVQEQFLDFMDTVPLLKWMVSEDRPRAKDLPRDERGRIIVDITHPHILEDVDYFRPAIKFYEENGCYTFLRPNNNPNSEFQKWLREEARRCRDGYVRESDGEWVTGQMYWFLNYCPIMVNVKSEKTGIYHRVEGFPAFWEGIYYRYHYLDQARNAGKHGVELARRGAGKSYCMAGIMSHNLLLGEDLESTKRVTTVLTAYTKEYLSQKDGTFSKFTPMIDFCAANTEFPRLMLTRRESDMLWIMGYKNSNGNVSKDSSKNSVMGLSVKDDEGKIRGKRGFILFEEMGNYPNFKDVWDNVRDSVKEGDNTFALMYAIGTAGDKESDFSSIRTILYKPDAYEVYSLENVYDKKGRGAGKFSYFFPSYISRADCMDENGNSDVVKALLQILMERWNVKQSGDAASLLKRTAQMPVTPEEAILRVRSTFFPTVMLNERIRQLDSLPHIYDDIYVGELFEVNGKVQFKATHDFPIREYPVDNTERGALEIYAMPPDQCPSNRYVVGVDPVDNDKAESQSLMSVIVFDLFNDEIAAEYTGRQELAESGYEIVRLLAIFFNAQVIYESNRKMMYSYFSKKRCLWMLADCPEWIRAKGLVKYDLFGSSIKGVSVNASLISTGIDLINDWLKKPAPVEYEDENGQKHIEHMPQLYKIRNRALLQELVSYAPEKNTDRVSAMFQVMFYREQFIILYGDGSNAQANEKEESDDSYFDIDWKRQLERLGPGYKPISEL